MSRHAPAQHPLLDRRGVLTALAVTALWHAALLGWLSTLGPRTRERGNATALAETVDIVFLPRREDEAGPAATAVPMRPPAPDRAGDPVIAAPPVQPTPGRPEPTPPAANGAELQVVTGEDRWARAASPAFPVGDRRPFERPRNPLARDEFDAPLRLNVRMRPPPSVEAWLKVLAPAGYEADPCPELARAIAGLASDTAAVSRALLDDAVRYEAQYCR